MKGIIIGIGSIGKRHLKNFKKFPIEILSFSKHQNSTKKDKSLDLCLSEKYDFGLVTNVTNLHTSTSIKLAKSNSHIFIEKPLSNSLLNLKILEKLVNEKNLITLIGCNLRFHPCLIKIKNLLSQKILGKIIFVQAEHGSYLPNWHPNEDYKKSYAGRKELGGGVVLTSIHEIDYLYWLFGDIVEVYSQSGNFSNLKINAEDYSATLLKFKNGIVGELHLDYFQHPSSRKCKIVGTKGTIIWDYNQNLVKLFDNKTNKWNIILKLNSFDINSTYVDEISHFLSCIKQNKKTINSLHDGIKTLKISLAILKSSVKKKAVKIK